MVDQRLQMEPAAHAPYVGLLREQRMPAQHFKAIEPLIFDHQEPSGMVGRFAGTNRAQNMLAARAEVHGNTFNQDWSVEFERDKRSLEKSGRGTVTTPRSESKRSVNREEQDSHSQKCSR
jgi:hypothetical protein